MWSVGALEVSTGKVSSIEAMNGSTVLLPCTYSSCIGIKNLYFNWHFNDNGTMNKVWLLQERIETLMLICFCRTISHWLPISVKSTARP